MNLTLTLWPAKSSPTFNVAISLFQLKIILPVSLPFSIVTPISLLLFTKVLINSVKSSVIVVLWAVPLPVLVIVIVKLASSLPWTILGSNILLMSILGWYTLT